MLFAGCDFTSGLNKEILIAQTHVSNQEFEKAVTVYEEILQQKPPKNIQVKINFQLGDIYSLYLNDYAKSLSYYTEVINAAVEPLWQVKALEKTGAIYFEQLKNYEKAKYAYKRLTNFYPRLERQDYYMFRYGLCHFHESKYQTAKEIFEALKDVEGERVGLEAYFYLGLIHFYQQNWEESVSQWFEYLKRETRKDKIVEVKFLIGNAYESSEKLKEAYNIYYSIIGEYPNPEVIESRLNSLYERRVARKR